MGLMDEMGSSGSTPKYVMQRSPQKMFTKFGKYNLVVNIVEFNYYLIACSGEGYTFIICIMMASVQLPTNNNKRRDVIEPHIPRSLTTLLWIVLSSSVIRLRSRKKRRIEIAFVVVYGRILYLKASFLHNLASYIFKC
ncbi:hypothetical protein PsorP6_016030 [Peronosclerospora sorghi]|uniref:Uncharacterized protein n=1 Tax=Peronosclerospora sorghi TaxID=230839 RepID=A0ACC0WMA1_9STRA|nr:hypothetical protein PsorP6_016030 [Peronosclerospora sorghi]